MKTTKSSHSGLRSADRNAAFGHRRCRHGPALKFGLEANHYIERSDRFGPEWMIGVPNILDKSLGMTK